VMSECGEVPCPPVTSVEINKHKIFYANNA